MRPANAKDNIIIQPNDNINVIFQQIDNRKCLRTIISSSQMIAANIRGND
jgi:hypothetical protein